MKTKATPLAAILLSSLLPASWGEEIADELRAEAKAPEIPQEEHATVEES